MKKLIYILGSLLLFACQPPIPQEFKKTDLFKLELPVIDWSDPQENLNSYERIDTAILYSISDTNKAIALLPISEMHAFEGYEISLLDDVNLKHVKRVFKIKLEHVYCYSFITTQTIIELDDDLQNRTITLPSIGYTYIDEQTTFPEYHFPTNPKGKEGVILKLKQQDTLVLDNQFLWEELLKKTSEQQNWILD